MKLQEIREWFKIWPERQTLFGLGLLFASGMANYMLIVLVTFLTDVWKINLKHAVIIINIQGALSGIWGILVVSFADHLGHYWMVIMASVFYCLGLGLLSTSVPRYYFDGGTETCIAGAKICAKNLKSSLFYLALFCISFAKAGHVVSLRALTFDKLKCIKLAAVQGPRRRYRFRPLRTARQKQKSWLQISCGTFLSAGAVTASAGFVSFHKDWHSRFEVSAFVMAGGILVFLSGYWFHPPAWVRQSPFVAVFVGLYVTIVKPFFTNRPIRHPRNHLGAGHIELVNLNTHLPDEEEEEEKDEDEDTTISADQGQNQRFCYVFYGWIRCTEEQKNQLKSLRCVIPISLTFIMYGMIKSISGTFFIEQAKTMNRDFNINFLGNNPVVVKVPIQLLSLFADMTKIAMTPLYRIMFEKRISRSNRRYSHAMKIGLGLLAALFSCYTASVAEVKRLMSLKDNLLLDIPDGIAPITMFWLTPQFVLTGMMEGLAYDGMKDFFEQSVHSSLIRYGVVLREVVTALGKISNVVFVLVLDAVVMKINRNDASWFADTVNGGHLDHFFTAVVVVSILNLICFAIAATSYSYPQVTTANEDEEPVEESANIVEIV